MLMYVEKFVTLIHPQFLSFNISFSKHAQLCYLYTLHVSLEKVTQQNLSNHSAKPGRFVVYFNISSVAHYIQVFSV